MQYAEKVLGRTLSFVVDVHFGFTKSLSDRQVYKVYQVTYQMD